MSNITSEIIYINHIKRLLSGEEILFLLEKECRNTKRLFSKKIVLKMLHDNKYSLFVEQGSLFSNEFRTHFHTYETLSCALAAAEAFCEKRVNKKGYKISYQNSSYSSHFSIT